MLLCFNRRKVDLMGAAVARAPSPGATFLQPGIIRAALRAFRVAAAGVIIEAARAILVRAGVIIVVARLILVAAQATTGAVLTTVVAVVIHNALDQPRHFATGHTLTLVQEMWRP